MKPLLLVIVSALMFGAGWGIFPHVLVMNAGDCKSETTLIYDEPTRVVVSHAHWFSQYGVQEHFYLAHLKILSDSGQAETVLVNRNVGTRYAATDNGFDVVTNRAFRVAGPETSDPYWGRYIDPLAEKGFHAQIYLFRVPGGRLMTGYRNFPIAGCMASH